MRCSVENFPFHSAYGVFAVTRWSQPVLSAHRQQGDTAWLICFVITRPLQEQAGKASTSLDRTCFRRKHFVYLLLGCELLRVWFHVTFLSGICFMIFTQGSDVSLMFVKFFFIIFIVRFLSYVALFKIIPKFAFCEPHATCCRYELYKARFRRF